jgi:NitT/TauT family transport system permease protein
MALSQLALGVAVLLIWQGASGRLVDNFFISNPIDIGARLYRWTVDGSIFGHIGATLYATAMGFIIGSVGGAVLGIWLGVSPFASRLLVLISTRPTRRRKSRRSTLGLWSGSASSRRSRSQPCSYCPRILNTFAGVCEVDRDLIDGAWLIRATRAQIILKVVIPLAMSWPFAGLKIAMPCA